MKYKYSEMMELIRGMTPKTIVPEYWNGTIQYATVKKSNVKTAHRKYIG